MALARRLANWGMFVNMDDHHVALPNARICEPGSEALNVRLERLVFVSARSTARMAARLGALMAQRSIQIAQRFVTSPTFGAEIRRIENGHRRPPTTIGSASATAELPASTRVTGSSRTR